MRPQWNGSRFFFPLYGSYSGKGSTNGLTWEDYTIGGVPGSGNWIFTGTIGNNFVVFERHTSTNWLYFSSDLVTWTTDNTPYNAGYFPRDIASNADIVVLISGTHNQCHTVESGGTWTARSMPHTAEWIRVKWFEDTGLFVAIAKSLGYCAYSTDGKTWISRTLPFSADWSDIAYGEGFYVMVSLTDSRIIYSTNLTTWNTLDTGYDNFRCIEWVRESNLFLIPRSFSAIRLHLDTNNDDAVLTTSRIDMLETSTERNGIAYNGSIYVVTGGFTSDLTQYLHITRDANSWSRFAGDGSEGNPWVGLTAIPWGDVTDTLYLQGDFIGRLLIEDKSGLTLRGDGATPGAILNFRDMEWTGPDANGEYTSNVLLDDRLATFVEDGARLWGPQPVSSQRIFLNSVASDEITTSLVSFTGRVLETGDVIYFYQYGGVYGAPPTGLSMNTVYYAITGSAYNKCKLAASYADALAGTSIPLGDWTRTTANRVRALVKQASHDDSVYGSLAAGTWDIAEDGTLYYKPTNGVIADHTVEVAMFDYNGALRMLNCADCRVTGLELRGGIDGVFNIETSQRITVDSCVIAHGRYGLQMITTEDVKYRHNHFYDIGMHAAGPRDPFIANPRMLGEYNVFDRIGRLNDFLENQAMMVTANSNGTIFRYNIIRDSGISENRANVALMGCDSSSDMDYYGNIFIDCNGQCIAVACGGGNAHNIKIHHNIAIRQGQGAAAVNAAPTMFVRVNILQATTYNIEDVDIYGNIILDANVVGFNGAIFSLNKNKLTIERVTIRDNFLSNIDGLIARMESSLGSGLPDVTFERNTYCGTGGGITIVEDGTTASWDGSHLIGTEAGYWSFDQNQDAGSYARAIVDSVLSEVMTSYALKRRTLI
jgi:hypothetical protein